MAKNIKKSVKYLIIITGLIILIPLLTYSLINIPKVQTVIVNRYTKHLSNDLYASISVGEVKLRFFNRMRLKNITVKDVQNDTIFHIDLATINIRKFEPARHNFIISKISIENPSAKLFSDSTGTINISYVLEMLKANKKGNTRNKKNYFSVSSIDILNGSCYFESNSSEKQDPLNKIFISGINGSINNLSINDSSVLFNVEYLSLKESSGFKLKDLQSSASIKGKEITLTSTSIHGTKSDIHIPKLSLLGDSATGFREFKDKVGIELTIGESNIYSTDLSCFIKQAGRVDESISVSGSVYGTVSELRGRDIKASFRDSTRIDADIDISGLPDLADSYIYIGINTFTSNASDFEKIKVDGNKNIPIPDIVSNLGQISIKGSYTGFITDFVAYGSLSSAQGEINTDISVKPSGFNYLNINGLIEGRDIALDRLTSSSKLLGNINLSAEIDGIASRHDNYSGSLSGKIDSIEINNYQYRDIGFNGSFDENKWDGHITVSEENIELDLLGLLNFDKQMPQFDFTLNIERSNLYALNIDKTDTVSSLSMLLTANFEGNNIDNLDGEVLLHNSNFSREDKTLDLTSFSLSSHLNDAVHTLALRTDYVDADVAGNYNSSDLSSIVRNLLASLLPSKFGNNYSYIDLKDNNLTFNINFKNIDKLNDFFDTGFSLADDSHIEGQFVQDSLFKIEGSAGYFGYKNFNFEKLKFLADIQSTKLEMDVNSESLRFPWQSSLNDFSLDLSTKPDSFNIEINWNDEKQITGQDRIAASGNLSSFKGQINPIIIINIEPTTLYNNNRMWEIGESTFTVDTTSINIDHFNIKSNNRYFNLNGTVSENKLDTLFFDFSGIDLSPINNIANNNMQINNSSLALNLEGIINGNMLLTDVFDSPLLESDIRINDFAIYDSNYGDLRIETEWNNISRQLDITGNNDLLGTKMVDVNGYYDPGDSYFDIDFIASHLPTTVLNTLLKSFASDISGTTSGKLNLSGYPKRLALNGALFAENDNIKINLLNTVYTVNDSIYFAENGIFLRNTQVTDDKGNHGSINGTVHHDYFKNFNANLLINANRSMVLNTREKDNEYVYGNVYATGVTTIKSDQSSISVDISASTEKNTRVYIPLIYNEQKVSENSFISFVNKDPINSLTTSEEDQQTRKAAIASNVNIELAVTPDAVIQLIFDSKLGDLIETTGSGNLNISYDNVGVIRITGDYLIDQGNYLFTLGDLLNKSFSLEDGGKITFNGDIEDTEIEVKGIYSVRASLYDILQDDRFNERVPVECQLTLTGNLMNPVIEIGIYLPNANEETRSYLNSVISTDEELSRQFVSLLVMNSFYASSSSPTTSGSSALSVTTTEMLLNQVGNWLSQISNDFDIGFLYSPGFNNDINSQEFQVALSTQILDNKVTINSDLGYRGSNATSSGNEQITGDFDIEYKITEKIRFKAFNRFNNPYQGRQADYTQGVGIFYRQEFNKFGDIFSGSKNTDAIKEEDIAIDDN